MLTRWNDFGALGRLAARDFGCFDSLDELRRQMDRMLFALESSTPFTARVVSETWPAVTIADEGQTLVVRAEVPGLDADDLKLSVYESSLTLEGERPDRVPEGYSVRRKERGAHRFTKSFTLPAKVDAERASAELKNGILTVTLPKAKEAGPRQISVRAS